MMKRYVISWLLLLILAIAFSAGLFWYRSVRNEPTYDRREQRGETWQRYNDKKLGFSFEIPLDWSVATSTQVISEATETTVVIHSPDWEIETDSREFPPSGTVRSGYELTLWVQEPSNLKTFDDLRRFYKLGSEGHIVTSENIATVYRVPALLHELGDYQSGFLTDVHMLYGDRWVTLGLSAPAQDKRAGLIFDHILASFVAGTRE